MTTPNWTIHDSWRVNNRVLTPGVEVSISGERGRFRFMRAITRPDGAGWLDFIGGPPGGESWRSFRAERVRTVHSKPKTRANTKGDERG